MSHGFYQLLKDEKEIERKRPQRMMMIRKEKLLIDIQQRFSLSDRLPSTCSLQRSTDMSNRL